VEINSIGDRDAMAKHERELNNYYKKHAASLPPPFRAAFKANIFDILTANEAGCEIFRESAPKSVSYLGEAGRKHFMEVLNYLEMLDIPYRINHGLLGNRALATHAVFEIKHIEADKETTLAIGSRYNALSKKLGFKKELPAVGISIHFKKKSLDESFKTITNPKFYFIQFGNDARLRSMKLIEMLRKERISVYHALTHDKLQPQMTAAENLKVPYILIMGQKEALENTIVVRNINTRAQETVCLHELASYLKKLK
jgi:histidyl-tRNA synthetase